MRKLFWIVGGIAVAVGCLILPVSYDRVLTVGTDTYQTHRPVFGSRHVEQIVPLQRDITGVGALLVNLKRAPALSPVEVVVRDASGHIISEGSIQPSAIVDDQFAWAVLSHRIPANTGEVTLDISAPEATAQNPIGIRFEGEGEKRLAVGVTERMPAWARLALWRSDHPDGSRRLLSGILVAAIVGVLGTCLHGRKILENKKAWALSLLLLALFATALRLPLVASIEGVFGGDAYNHLFKTRAWLQGDDPFASDFRKGPFFSVLLAPGLAGPDPLLWGRWMSLLSSVAAVVLVAVLARRLGLPPVMSLLAGFLLAVMREFQFEAVSSLSNMTYAALVVGAAAAFVSAKQRRQAYVVGVLGSLAALTRYEGVLVPAMLLPPLWLYHRLRPRFILYTLVPVVVLLVIPFLLWPITGEVGVRTPADIKGDGGLSVALSAYEFRANALQLKTILGLEWFLSPAGGRQLFTLGVGAVAGAALAFGRRRSPRIVHDILAAGGWVILIWAVTVVVRDFNDTLKLLMLGMTLLAGAGGGWLAVQKPRWGIPLMIMVVAQGVAVTAILPKPRYYIHLVPFLVLGVLAIMAGITDWRRQWSRVGVFLAAGFLVGLVWQDAADALPGMVSDYNSKAYESALMERAARFLRGREGDIGIITDDLPFRIYAGDDRLTLYRPLPEGRPATLAEQQAWIESSGVNYVVEASFEPLFSIAERQPELFTKLETFTSRYHEGEVAVYEVKAKTAR